MPRRPEEEPTPGKRIDELYAWVVTHDNGGEGLIGMEMPPGSGQWLPFVGADKERMQSLRLYAIAIHCQMPSFEKTKLSLLHFSSRATLEEIGPDTNQDILRRQKS